VARLSVQVFQIQAGFVRHEYQERCPNPELQETSGVISKEKKGVLDFVHEECRFFREQPF
jgi:hypothetical protein